MRRTRTLLRPFTWKDVPYTAEHHVKQTLDIAIPGQPFPRQKLPTCVFVHGGSWQRGDKAGGLNKGIDEAFVRAGFIGVSVNYRLSPEVLHPDHAEDVAHAVKWLHNNIDKYGGDPERLILIGHSAGAHLVMQVLANPSYLHHVGVCRNVDTFVKGAVGISGVYNIVRIANTALYGAIVVTPVFGNRVDGWREASIASVLVKEGPTSPLISTPLLCVTAEDDFHFGVDAQELEQWLTSMGHKSFVRTVIPKRNHFSIIGELTANPDDELMQAIKKFVEQL